MMVRNWDGLVLVFGYIAGVLGVAVLVLWGIRSRVAINVRMEVKF